MRDPPLTYFLKSAKHLWHFSPIMRDRCISTMCAVMVGFLKCVANIPVGPAVVNFTHPPPPTTPTTTTTLSSPSIWIQCVVAEHQQSNKKWLKGGVRVFLQRVLSSYRSKWLLCAYGSKSVSIPVAAYVCFIKCYTANKEIKEFLFNSKSLPLFKIPTENSVTFGRINHNKPSQDSGGTTIFRIFCWK